jgi:serine/threonine protein kinase
MEVSRTIPIKQTLNLRRQIKRCADCGQQFSADAMFCPFDGNKLDAASWDPSGDQLLSTTIDGRYEVKSVLGEGGMGTVYEVRHRALGRSFAMKVLRRDIARDPDLAKRFIHEAKATAAVKHPHIVSITDFGALEDGTPFFVMELLVGQTLAQTLRSGGPLPAGRVAKIVLQVASALGAAHEAGIVHRDLKPENVFLVGRSDLSPTERAPGPRDEFDGPTLPGEADTEPSSPVPFIVHPSQEDEVRIVDFGAAKIMGAGRMTKTGIVFGTPHYMSPEQASGQPVDHRADIYALGVIMYEMFTGHVPFEADTYMGVLTQHMFVEPTPPSVAIPELADKLGALEEILLRALTKKPENRYQSMQAVGVDVQRVVRFESDGSVQIAPRLEGTASRRPRPLPSQVDAIAEAPEDPKGGAIPGLAAPFARWFAIMLGCVVGVGVAGGGAMFLRRREAAMGPERGVSVTTSTGLGSGELGGGSSPPNTAPVAALPAPPPSSAPAAGAPSVQAGMLEAAPAPQAKASPSAAPTTKALGGTFGSRAAATASAPPRHLLSGDIPDPWEKR